MNIVQKNELFFCIQPRESRLNSIKVNISHENLFKSLKCYLENLMLLQTPEGNVEKCKFINLNMQKYYTNFKLFESRKKN